MAVSSHQDYALQHRTSTGFSTSQHYINFLDVCVRVCVCVCVRSSLCVDVFHRIFSQFISNATTHEAQQAKSFPTFDLLCSLFPVPHPFSPFPAQGDLFKLDTMFKFHVLTGLVLWVTVLYIFIAGMCRGLGAVWRK